MSKEIEIANNNTSVPIEKIRSYLEAMNLASNLTKAEANQFIEIASAYGLNPFKREIYASKYGSNFSIIVGFETYLKRAERSGKLAGWSVETSGNIDWNNIMNSGLCATITIYRKDWNYPFIHSVYFCEYVQRKSDGTPNKFWREKPYTMIKKVAMAQGFRLCFSDENGGLPYTSEEISNEQTMDAIIVESKMPVASIETVSMEEKAKRGRPKKEDKPEVDIMAIKAKITTAMNVDDLRAVWNDCPECKTIKELKDAITERKKFLESKVESVSSDIMSQIKNAKDESEVWDLIENVTDAQVLKFAKTKIEELTK